MNARTKITGKLTPTRIEGFDKASAENNGVTYRVEGTNGDLGVELSCILAEAILAADELQAALMDKESWLARNPDDAGSLVAGLMRNLKLAAALHAAGGT